MLVLPQDGTPEQLAEILEVAYAQRRTFRFSHDDAGNLNGTAVLYVESVNEVYACGAGAYAEDAANFGVIFQSA